jgi:glucose-1-phosphate cytidylyltransferase
VKVVILAGGLGTRIAEESHTRPKPMIEIGGRPMLWHIMKLYTHHGFNEFIVCCGYKGYYIKEYFANMLLHNSDITIDIESNRIQYHSSSVEPWLVTLVDTGEATLTGGRVKRVRSYLSAEEPFCLTYGDGLADIDFKKLVAFHKAHGKLATVTAVAPPGRYGALDLEDDRVASFIEKPTGDSQINGGFFVLHPKVIDRIAGDETAWERGPLGSLATDGELVAYRHRGFWAAMDTLRDKMHLEELWQSGRAPWKAWVDGPPLANRISY